MAGRKPIVINTSGQGQQELPATDWIAGDVSYAVSQSLTAAQQAQARANEGSAAAGTNTDIASVLLGSSRTNPSNSAAPGISIGTIAGSAAANFAAIAPGTAQGQSPGYDFWPTFQGTGDNGPRRAASIRARFNAGNWGTETLDFLVGNGGAANDAAAAPTIVFSLTGAGASPAPLPISQGGTSTTTSTGTGSVVLATSPALAGAPTAPTPATSDSSTRLATTAMVQAAVQQSGAFNFCAGILF